MLAAFLVLFVLAIFMSKVISYLSSEKSTVEDVTIIKSIINYQKDLIKETTNRFDNTKADSAANGNLTCENLKLLKVNLSIFKAYLLDRKIIASLSDSTRNINHQRVIMSCDKFISFIEDELRRSIRTDSVLQIQKEYLTQQSTLLNQACMRYGIMSFGKVKQAESRIIATPDSTSAQAFDLALVNFELELAKNVQLTGVQQQDLALQFDLYKQQAYSISYGEVVPVWKSNDLFRDLKTQYAALLYSLDAFETEGSSYVNLMMSSTNFYTLLAMSFTLVCSLGISMYYSRALTLPIGKLSKMVDNMVSNNFRQISQQTLNTEITELQMLNTSVFMMANTIQENLEMIARKNEDLANLYNETLDNINTARTIQHSLMPPMTEVLKALPESFVLNRPKDIVSGDFYWIDNNSDVLKIAVADCTGHGVAGAFMSFVGHSLLTRITDETPIFFDAASILDRLNDGVKQTLRQADDGSFTQNGMDISLVCIDFFRGVLHFAGANQTLYLIRNGELNTIKSNKFSIGGPTHKANLAFTNHKVAFLPGDSIYLSSDGFADQIGGPTGDEKFKSSRLRTLFQNINNLPMEEQGKVLSKVLEQWLGPNQLLDDVLVIGFKVPDI